jgi:Family of unknown function (DUF6221)
MTELSDFLLARIAEDVAAARAVSRPVGGQQVQEPSAHHIVGWGPERVVAACDATRQVVETCAAALAEPALRRKILASTVNQDRGRRELADRTLRLLAVPYAGHPDHRPEWRP